MFFHLLFYRFFGERNVLMNLQRAIHHRCYRRHHHDQQQHRLDSRILLCWLQCLSYSNESYAVIRASIWALQSLCKYVWHNAIHHRNYHATDAVRHISIINFAHSSNQCASILHSWNARIPNNFLSICKIVTVKWHLMSVHISEIISLLDRTVRFCMLRINSWICHHYHLILAHSMHTLIGFYAHWARSNCNQWIY